MGHNIQHPPWVRRLLTSSLCANKPHPSAVCRTHLAFPLERVPTALVHERVPVVLAVAVAERRLDRLLARGLVELDPLL